MTQHTRDYLATLTKRELVQLYTNLVGLRNVPESFAANRTRIALIEAVLLVQNSLQIRQ